MPETPREKALDIARLVVAVESLGNDVKEMANAQREIERFLYRGNGGQTVRERLAVGEQDRAQLNVSVNKLTQEFRDWRDKPSPVWQKMAVIGGWLFGFLAFALQLAKTLASGGAP